MTYDRMQPSEFDQDSGPPEAIWFAKVQSGQMTEQEYLEFANWLEADDDNRRKYQECEKTLALLDTLSETPDIIAMAESLNRKTERPQKSVFARWRWASAVAASILCVLVWQTLTNITPSQVEFITGIGEQVQTTLEDDSIAFLNTNTKLRVEFNDNKRTVYLEYGEAMFDVSKDANRPFEVITDNRIARAIGTKFSVSYLGDRVTLSVIEGTVEIDNTGIQVKQTLPRFNAGQTAGYRLADDNFTVGSANIARLEALEQGKIYFENVPLSQALIEYNRYSLMQLRTHDEALNQLEVTGLFDINDLNGFVFVLQNSLQLSVTEEHGEWIIKSRNL